MSEPRDQFSVQITCPGCGAHGVVHWEESAAINRARGPARRLIALHGPFVRMGGNTDSGDPAIACEKCGTVQQD